jgi:hypothetical protein
LPDVLRRGAIKRAEKGAGQEECSPDSLDPELDQPAEGESHANHHTREKSNLLLGEKSNDLLQSLTSKSE